MFGRATITLGIGPHSSFSFVPCLISAAVDWMSTILHTWCGLSANLGCRSEMGCMRLAEKYRTQKLIVTDMPLRYRQLTLTLVFSPNFA